MEREELDEIEITPAMIRAGVRALEDQLLEGCSLEGLRPELVQEVFCAMANSSGRYRSVKRVPARNLTAS
jgi:hypothetical protein